MFYRPEPPEQPKEFSRALSEHADELTRSASELQEELDLVKRTAREKGTDPLAELVRSMQRGRKKMGAAR